MKTNITICLDHELVIKLRAEGNMSSTINDLLTGHIFGGGSRAGVQKALDDQAKEVEKAKEKLESIREKLGKMPKNVVRYT